MVIYDKNIPNQAGKDSKRKSIIEVLSIQYIYISGYDCLKRVVKRAGIRDGDVCIVPLVPAKITESDIETCIQRVMQVQCDVFEVQFSLGAT